MLSSFSPSPRRNRRAGVVAAVLAVSLAASVAGCGGDSQTQSGDQGSAGQQALYDEAVKAGGNLTVFIGSSGNEALTRLKEAFNEQYPDINLEWINGTGDQVMERLLTEKRAGLNTADVLNIPGLREFQSVDNEGYIEHYVPEDADSFTYDRTGYIDGVAYSHSDYFGAACYNPNNLTNDEIELLKTYEGWADPVFKGRTAIVNPAGFGYRRTMSYYVFENPDLGMPWLEKLAANDPVVYANQNMASTQVVAGEHDVVINSQSNLGPRAAADGAPLECVAPSPAAAIPFSIGIIKGAPNPAAAKLYENWVLSEAGQEAYRETLAYSHRRQGMNPPEVPGEVRRPDVVAFANEDTLNAHYDELNSTFERLFGAAKE
jgi:iron(III) transport system substrate-binding protein